MDALPFCPQRYTNMSTIKVAKRLAELAPGCLSRVLFAPSATTAIGMALKPARAATRRFKMISMRDSFHGASLDAISIGGEAIFRAGAGPLLPGTEHVPPPDPYHCLWDCGGECNKCARYVEYVLEKEGDVDAVIAETTRSRRFTLEVDKAYDSRDLVTTLRVVNITPHVAQNSNPRRSAIDGRTTRHRSYAMSQSRRSITEPAFGWLEAVAGMRKVRRRGKNGLVIPLSGSRIQSVANPVTNAGGSVVQSTGRAGRTVLWRFESQQSIAKVPEIYDWQRGSSGRNTPAARLIQQNS